MRNVFLLMALLFFNFSYSQQPFTKVKVTGGELEGVTENGIKKFLGIPFAASTAGENRWKAPQPVKSWEGVLKADKFAPSCPQMSFFPGTQNNNSEDCLYLNVWTPAKSSKEKLPVMVWIYGGGFAMGSTNIPSNYGDKLAEKGVILVSIAYRVGPLGFMAHPELSKKSPKGISGNYGLLDQIAGLKWVQENISGFGGDPSKVTIFGESAGGISVSMLCASPLTKGLFSGAISQSGGSFGPVKDRRIEGGIQNLASAEKEGVEFMKRMGVSSLAELRKLDPSKWLKDPKSQMGGFWPVVDNYVIVGDQYKLYEAGKYNDVNVIIGTNSDEGSLFARPTTIEQYKERVNKQFGKFADKVFKLYPGGNDKEVYTSTADLFRETAFAWPSYAWANLQSKTGKSKVFVYYFDQQQPNKPWIKYNIRGAAHADEVSYVFNKLPPNVKPEDVKLSDLMATYWTNFAKTGNPNGKGIPKWPVYKPGKNSVMYLNSQPKAGPVANLEKLELMEEIFKHFRETE